MESRWYIIIIHSSLFDNVILMITNIIITFLGSCLVTGRVFGSCDCPQANWSPLGEKTRDPQMRGWVVVGW